MKLEFKNFEFKIDDADSKSGMIRGYASTFGNIDLGDDVIDQGAFKKTLQESKGKWPILADHDPSKQIGWNLRAEEDEKGLLVEGQIDVENSAIAREKYSLAKKALEIGAKMGLSIGFMTVKAMPDKERPSVRRIKELKMFEYSMVTFPMNTQAMVTNAKNFFQGMEKKDFLQAVIQKSEQLGMSKSEIISALTTYEPQILESKDPAELGQSLDKLIYLLSTP